MQNKVSRKMGNFEYCEDFSHLKQISIKVLDYTLAFKLLILHTTFRNIEDVKKDVFVKQIPNHNLNVHIRWRSQCPT